MKNNKDVVLECRIAKIELEHEVLLREMDVILIGIAGLPVTILTLILQFELYKNGLLFLTSLLLLVIGLGYLNDYRTDRKEKLLAKEKELDTLILEITKSSNQVSKLR
jgi:hypothetical protein